MKKLALDQWEEKYIVGSVERFDQKYTMFNRPGWDPEIQGLLEDWSFIGEVKDKPGYTGWEQALSRASSRATQLSLFNIHRPNPDPVTMDIMRAMVRTDSNSQPVTRPPRKDRRVINADPQTATRNVKKVARYFGADVIGVCRLDRRWVYSHTYGGNVFEDSAASGKVAGESERQEIPEEFQYAVVMGFEMEYDMMRYYPSYIADTVTGMGYSRMAIANAQLAAFIRGLGYKTIDCSINNIALSIPLALLAGMGDLGRNGLLITPQFGPRLRLSKVLTDLPLILDAPIDFGVTEFCRVCKKCAELCPSQAIMPGERTAQPRTASNVAGELKWPLQAEKCRMYWARANKPCSTCIACCPYNKPNSMFHRTVRWLTDNMRWADSFYIWADNLLGYSRPGKAEDFWHEWQPRRNQTPLWH